MKFNSDDVGNICKTVLIGMPAAGKSTIGKYIVEGISRDVGVEIQAVSTDLRLKRMANDPNNTFVQKFLGDHDIPLADQSLLVTASKFMAKYGEPLFRDYESAVIVNMLENGDFEGKIPDLGGKAILHPRTAKAFKEKGYQCVYLDVNSEDLARNLMKDFLRWCSGAEITRSNINTQIKKATENADSDWLAKNAVFCKAPYNDVNNENLGNETYHLPSDFIKNRDSASYDTAKNVVKTLLKQREAGYRRASTAVIHMGDNLEENVEQIMRVVRNNNKQGKWLNLSKCSNSSR